MTTALRKYAISLFFFVLIIQNTILPLYASAIPSINVTTHKEAYLPGENLQIYGNLTFNETLVTDGLVGIQIQTPGDHLLTIRTVNTGTNPSTTPYVEVRSVVPCNSSGGPKESFKRGTLAYFKITVRNNDPIESRHALITVNLYNPDNIPFGSASIETTLHPWTTSTTIISIPIPTDATTGNSTAYANAYTGWPKNEIEPGIHGTPYCPEVSETFQITDGTSQSATPTTHNQSATTLGVNGNYNLTLQLAPEAESGNCSIYVSSRYWGEETFNSTTLKVLLQGDFDGDWDIDVDDIRYFCNAYIQYCAEGIKDELCDFDHDCDIDIDDIRAFCEAYIEYWS